MIDIQVIASSSKGNCYRITDGYTPLLLECGLPIKKIKEALNFKLSSIAGCLVSHSHMDHVKAAKDIVKAGIGLYCSEETAEAVNVSGHRVHHVSPMKHFTIKSWTVLAFPTVHDVSGSYGYLLANGAGEKLLFLTDSSYCKYRFKGLTHLMLEANFSQAILDRNVEQGIVEEVRRKRLMESHFSIERVLDLLERNDLSSLVSIYLMHLSDENSDEENFKRLVQQKTGVPVVVC